VTIAFTRFKADLPRIVPGLSKKEWEALKRDEDRRRCRGFHESDHDDDHLDSVR
jgi:hypothetical protein